MSNIIKVRDENALLQWIKSKSENSLSFRALIVLLGMAMLSALAHVQFRLPFTQVPVTGQTFGVVVISLAWGALAPMTVAGYLALGFMGLPVFAMGAGAFVFGPSAGYLFGMFVASVVVGYLSDQGYVKSFWSALGLAYVGSLCVFAVGLPVLAKFVGWENAWTMGILPFLPGDFLKNVLAAGLVSSFKKRT